MANGNALIAALRSATPQGITTAPGESTSFEAPWTNVSRRSLSDVLNMEAPFMPIESWRDTANIGPPYSGYKVPGYTRPDTDGTGDTSSNTKRPPAFGGSDEDWVDSNQFRNYQGRVLGGIENTYDTDKLQNDIAFFNTQLDDPIYGANAQMLKDAQEMQLAKISALDNFDTMNFY